MTPSGLARAEFNPIFDWTPRRGRKLSLFGFIAASAVLHALCFYIFQIIYPPTVALLPPPARISLISANSEEGRALLRWVEAEDPALASTTQRPPDAASFDLPNPQHVPSYLSRQPALKDLPPHQPDLGVPSSRPPGPVRVRPATSPPAASATKSALAFASETTSLGSPTIPLLEFKSAAKEPPHPAEFRVAIGSQGDIRYCFLDSSSGDSSLDEQARRYLLLCRFPPPETDTIWTTATFFWGSDIFAPPAVSAASSAP